MSSKGTRPVPENRTTQPWADKDHPRGEKKRQTDNVEHLRERYRRIGIASVAAAADACAHQRGDGRRNGGR
jgi:hypothetical protein